MPLLNNWNQPTVIHNAGELMKEGRGGRVMILGAAALVLAPVVLPVAAKLTKSLAKAAIKGGVLAYEKTQIAVAEATEVWQDLVEEVKAEVENQE